MFKKITIIGVGLIGGSIGLAAKKRKLAKEIVGVCRRESSRKKALKYKACDKATLSLKDGVRGADLVIIATPVGKIIGIAKEVMHSAGNKMILTDVGSTKEMIVKEIGGVAPERVRFVGSHPMAGSEKNSVEFADSRLFDNSICIVTKNGKTDKRAFSTVKKFWTKLGATCKELSPQKHDRYISSVSHLPHIAAVALAVTAKAGSLKFAAGGFKDTTRIASSVPGLWRDIFVSNKKALLSSLREYKKALLGIERSIKNSDQGLLSKYLEKAKKIRDRIK